MVVSRKTDTTTPANGEWTTNEDPCDLDDRDRERACLEFVGWHLAPLLPALEAEDVAVEVQRLVDVLRRQDDEVDPGDLAHELPFAFGLGRSVMVPSASSAASITDSDSVG